MSEENQTPVGAVSADPVHEEGTEHIKEQLANKQEGEQTTGEGTAAATTATESEPTVEPIVEPKPPASNPGSPDASGGISKGAGGVSGAAHVESPVPNKEKRKSIVGTLKGFLGFDKKDKGAAGAGTAADNTVLGTATAAISSAAGYVTGQTTEIPDRTKTSTSPDAAAVPSSEESKPAESKDQADTGAPTAPSAEPDDAKTAKKDESTEPKPSETSNEAAESTKKGGGGVAMENRDAIPTAGGEKLGEKHWGESDIVPENPKQGAGASDGGVASSEGQPTGEVADNTAKNTGGASGGPETATGGSAATAPEKQKFTDKIKKKLPFGKKE